MMDGEGVAVAELKVVATPFGGVSDDGDVGGASFLQGEAEELRGVAAATLTTGAGAVVLGAAAEDRSVAEGTKGLASTLRDDPTAVTVGCVSAAVNGDGWVDKAEAGARSGVLLEGLKTEAACEARMPISVGVDFVRGAVEREGVLVIGVVDCESGVEPGGVWRTESRKEKVWETGLRLSPVNNARLPLTSSPKLLLLATLAAVLLGSGLLGETFSSLWF